MHTAIITKDGDWWLGWVEEIPGANAQERTKAELLISLKEATKDIIELRRQEVRSEMKNDYEEVSLATC
jgi:predicted RNase H-like HicB family nuclease